MNPIIELKHISFSYPSGAAVLDDLNFTLHQGDRIGLVAPNGSGKTTLFHIIMGLLRPDSGTVKLFGTPAENESDFFKVRHRIGLLFQDSDDQLFCPTVLEDVAFGPLNMRKTRKEALEISRTTLAMLGLESFEDRVTFKLSGGEKRLAALATILAMEPDVLLLDEPTTGLDNDIRNKLVNVLNDLDISFILISHNMDFLFKLTPTVYTMTNGKILLDHQVRLHEHVHGHPHGAYPHEHSINGNHKDKS